MTQDELKHITKQHEKRTIEYKEAYSELPGNLFETVCAFLNRDGGVIVLGAHDDGIIAKNANRPSRAGNVTLDNYERHPKNPHMANFFVQIGRAEHLGTGIRNIYKYVPLYTGKQPIIDDENVYTVQMALPTLMNVESSGKSTLENKGNIVENIVEKLPAMRGRILKIIYHKPSVSASSIAKEVGIAPRNVQEHLKQLQSKGIIRRVGPDKGGHWEIIDN